MPLVDTSAPRIALRDVGKTYPIAGVPFTALAGITLEITAGEFVVVVGESGSGKSTLLALLAGIDRPTYGEVVVGGAALHAMSERELSAWRGRSIGIVFQFFQLLPTLTACENVMLPMDFCATYAARDRRPRALALLDRLGVADQAHKLPSRLSGGQQQRVAVARALANDPKVLLADEPTGNLDSRTSRSLLELFAGLAQEGHTIVVVTHDRAAMQMASRTIALADGRMVPATEGAHA